MPEAPGDGPLGVDWAQVALLTGLVAGMCLLWSTPLVYPLKILAVLFHEVSHGLAAGATGGAFGPLRVEEDESGACATYGGNAPIVLSAGYLGSLAWGCALMLLGSAGGVERLTSAAVGCVLLLVGLALVRPACSFGQLAALLWGAVLCAAGLLLGRRANELALQVVGLASCSYSVLDIKDDVIDRPWLEHSDAAELARLTGVPAATWGLCWLCVALVATAGLLLFASRAKAQYAHEHGPDAPLPAPVWDLPRWRRT